MVKHDIFSFCLRRSGHTAIMNWIASQVQPSHSFKDCTTINKILTTPVVHIIENDELESKIYRKHGLQHEDRDQRYKYLKDYELTLCAFEDCSGMDFSVGNVRNIVDSYSLVRYPKIVIVMRDPFNLFASRIWRNRDNLEVPYNNRAANWFNMQLRQFETQGDFIFVDYFYWVTSKSYRKHLANVLGIPFVTDKFHDKQANPSSFDDFDGEKVKLGFANRFMEFLEKANDRQKEEYLKLLEIVDIDLCCRYFMHLDCRETYEWIKETI